MNYLGVDTSGKNLTIIVCKNGEVFRFHDENCGVNHSVAVMPAIEKLIEETNFDLKSADFFACVVGAGSFTGIRIGVATVKALCMAFNKPCLSVTSFDTITYNKKQGDYLAVIDAKHNSFYVCGYKDLAVTYPPKFIDKEELLSLGDEYKYLTMEKIDGIDSEVVSIADGFVKAVESKKDQVNTDINSLVPLYIRKSQAEEGR